LVTLTVVDPGRDRPLTPLLQRLEKGPGDEFENDGFRVTAPQGDSSLKHPSAEGTPSPADCVPLTRHAVWQGLLGIHNGAGPDSKHRLGVARISLDFDELYIDIIYSIYTSPFVRRSAHSRTPMRILISNSSSDPIYEQVKNEIKREIVTGGLHDEEMLPSIRKLAKDLQISVITTKRAYDDLEKEGLITTVAGKGTFVSAKNLELIKEKKLRLIEAKLEEAVDAARLLGVKGKELETMLSVLLKEQ
jgi:GntR family transcriptional regulator